jgi:hypothetical protein
MSAFFSFYSNRFGNFKVDRNETDATNKTVVAHVLPTVESTDFTLQTTANLVYVDGVLEYFDGAKWQPLSSFVN